MPEQRPIDPAVSHRPEAEAAAHARDPTRESQTLITPFQPTIIPPSSAGAADPGSAASWMKSVSERLSRHWQVAGGASAVGALLLIALGLVFWTPSQPGAPSGNNGQANEPRHDAGGTGAPANPGPLDRVGPAPPEANPPPQSSRQSTTAPPVIDKPALTTSPRDNHAVDGSDSILWQLPDMEDVLGSQSSASPAVDSSSQHSTPPVSPPNRAGSTVPQSARVAIPDEAARGQAAKLMHEVLQADFAQAQSAEAKVELAQQLRNKADATQDNPAQRYVMLEAAQNLAVEGGDVNVAFQVIDSLARFFEVKPLPAKATVLSEIARAAHPAEANASLVEAALQLADEAVAADGFTIATVATELALSAARKTRDGDLVKLVMRRSNDVAELASRYVDVAQARQVLASDPTDPAANRIVGRYLCLVKGNWDQGLPLLSLSDDQQWKELAAADLSNPTDTTGRFQLANRWWAHSETADLEEQQQIRLRAGHWYVLAQPGLQGLERDLVQQRLLDIESAAPADSVFAGGPPLLMAPFTPADGARRQAEWARHLTMRPTLTNSAGIRLALVPPGQYSMGSPDSETGRNNDEGPRHAARLSRPFYVSTTEITVSQFASFVTSSGYQPGRSGGRGRGPSGNGFRPGPPQRGPSSSRGPDWTNPGYRQTADSPVVYITWDDAVAFCDWLSKEEGKRYRLPTEAEWEYCCRVGTETPYYGGDEKDALDYGWFQANAAGKPQSVGKRKPNGWGVYDMPGNVWEWCGDWYGKYPDQPQVDPAGATRGSTRVVRGGGADSQPTRAADRESRPPGSASQNVGFRVVCEIGP